MTSELKVDKITPASGTSLEVGSSGDTVTLASGASSSGFGATLTGSTNDTVVTVTGANAMQGEANLQFDGSRLGVNNSSMSSYDSNGQDLVVGSHSGSNGITIACGSSGSSNILFATGTTGDQTYKGRIRYNESDNHMGFYTDGDSERMRLDSSGQLFLGVTSSSGFNGSTFKVPNGFSVYRNTSTGGNGVLLFYSDANSTGGNVGYYLANGGLANYQSNNVNLSDERLKKDIVDCPSTWDKIKSLKVRNFKYTEDKEERVVTGLIAQETETVDANLVNSVNGLYGYEEEQKDGKFKQIYTTDLYHQMLKALQESQTRIETLEAKVKALEEA